MFNERDSWVHAGRQYDADVYVNLETGSMKHVGTKWYNDEPQLYDGPPNPLGKLGGDIVKTGLDILTGRRR